MPQPFAAIWASRRVSGIGLEPNLITFDVHPSATVLLCETEKRNGKLPGRKQRGVRSSGRTHARLLLLWCRGGAYGR
jgi:hypothetical protein